MFHWCSLTENPNYCRQL